MENIDLLSLFLCFKPGMHPWDNHLSMRNLLIIISIGLLVSGPLLLFFPLPKGAILSRTSKVSDDITFFSIPFPWSGGIFFHLYKFCFFSWLSLSHNTRVILFINDDFDLDRKLKTQIDEFFGPGRLDYVSVPKQDENGYIYLNECFRKASRISRTKYNCFIGANVFIDTFWYDRVTKIISSMRKENLLITGGNMNLYAPLNQIQYFWNSTGYFWNEAEKMGKYFAEKCILKPGFEYFLWSNDPSYLSFNDMPDFVMFGSYWDQWLLTSLKNSRNMINLQMEAPLFFIVPPFDFKFVRKEEKKHNLNLAKETYGDLMRIDQIPIALKSNSVYKDKTLIMLLPDPSANTVKFPSTNECSWYDDTEE